MAELPPVLYSILAHSETFLNTFCKNQAKQLQQLRALTEVVAVKKSGVFFWKTPDALGISALFEHTQYSVYLLKNTLQHLLHFVSNELNLGTNDDLYRSLIRTDNARNASGFNLLLINLGVVLDFKTKSCDAVVKACNVFFAADTFQNDLCNFCKVVVGKGNASQLLHRHLHGRES